MKKVLLIGDSPISMSPYITSYIELLEHHKIPYELVYWNKTLEDIDKLPYNFVPYCHYHNNNIPGWKKIFKISGFVHFAKKHIHNNDFSYIVVFTIAHAVFFHPFLEKQFHGRYVFDIRDHSPMCSVNWIRRIIKNLIDNSAFTVVSSEGFLRWLPKDENRKYIITHNTTLSALSQDLFNTQNIPKKELKILTIGQISYLESQLFFVEQLGNSDGISLQFSGRGSAVPMLQEYVREHRLYNVTFTGGYDKKEEPDLVRSVDMINIWLKSDINADSCMANRFYLSVLFRKPMIVHEGSFMAEICKKYGLGVVLEEGDDFAEKIKKWNSNLNFKIYSDQCRFYLERVREDIMSFETKLLSLVR